MNKNKETAATILYCVILITVKIIAGFEIAVKLQWLV